MIVFLSFLFEISGASMRWLRPKEGSPRIRGLIHVETNFTFGLTVCMFEVSF